MGNGGVVNSKPSQQKSESLIKQLDDQDIQKLLNELKQKNVQISLFQKNLLQFCQDPKNKIIYTAYKDGTYSGYWKNKQRDGIGDFYVSDEKNKYYYIGEWKEDVKSGYGAMFLSEKEYYFGNFQNDQFHGKGTFVLGNGDTYFGDWENNKQNGYGIENLKDGWKYEGQMKDGQRNGIGKLWNQFYEMEGEFLNNDFIKGKLLFLQQDSLELSYEGQMMDGRFHGYGILKWRNGTFYQGEFYDHQLSGQGEFHEKINENLIIRKGTWKEGKYNG